MTQDYGEQRQGWGRVMKELERAGADGNAALIGSMRPFVEG
jgi:hypothetical protein